MERKKAKENLKYHLLALAVVAIWGVAFVCKTAAIRSAGLDYAYIAMPVRPETLSAAVEGLRSLGFRGFNVTIPHKSAVMALLDEVDEDAKRRYSERLAQIFNQLASNSNK